MTTQAEQLQDSRLSHKSQNISIGPIFKHVFIALQYEIADAYSTIMN